MLGRYPEERKASGTLALLDLAQRQLGGYLTPEAINYIANYLEVAPIRVHEVASFYSMYNMQPVGKHFIQICRTSSCWLLGSDDITRTCLEKIGCEKQRQVSTDGLFSVLEVECLGACANAPMVQINDGYYEDLTPERMAEMIDDLRAGKEVPVGPQSGRHTSEPAEGAKTLTSLDFAKNGADAGGETA